MRWERKRIRQVRVGGDWIEEEEEVEPRECLAGARDKTTLRFGRWRIAQGKKGRGNKRR